MKHLNYLGKFYLLPILLILVPFAAAIGQPMSGTYTVGGASPNYISLTAAVNDLTAKGVSGPVTLNIRDGNYTEQIILPNIAGTSATSRVTIKSENGNAQNCVFSFNSPSNNNFVFRITGSYISVKNLKLLAQNGTYGNVLALVSSASYDSVSSCVLEAPVTTSTGTNMAVIFANQLFGTDNVIHNDSIKNGSMAAFLQGSNTSTRASGFSMYNNTVVNPYYMGIQLYYTESIKIRNNNFICTTPYTGTFYGVYSYYGYNALDISNNMMAFNSPGSVYGLHIYYSLGDIANPAMQGKIDNNTITSSITTGTSYPLNVNYCDFFTVSNNTINATTTSGTLYNYLYGLNYFTVNKNTVNFTTANGTIRGMYFYGSGYYNGTITNNKITTTSTSAASYGMYTAYLTNVNFINNDVNVSATSGTSYALYEEYSKNNNIYNNTFRSSGTGTSYGGYLYNSSTSYNNNNVRNNVFAKNSTGGVALYIYSQLYTNSDYNNIYAPSGNILQRVTPSLSTASLQTWRTTVGSEKNSISYDPGFTSTTSSQPDPSNASSWSLNGRGEHIAGNTTDFYGSARVTNKAAGVPDIGAYEFVPTSTPPQAVAVPAAPLASSTQVFTFGQDTVATLVWPAGAVPASIAVRQYTGAKAPTITSLSPTSAYFYTDISVPSGTYAHTSNIYYKDPWTGNTATEPGMMLAKKDGANPWASFAAPVSTTDANRNIINTTGQSTFGLYTGVDNSLNAGVSAVVNPTGTFCAGTIPVQVTVNNYGAAVVNSVTIKWTLDGIAQPDVPYATPIAAFGNATVTLGNVTFAGPARVIKAWTSLPNATTDPVIADDSVTATLRSSLNGVYTIGGTTPNYATLAAAVADLNLLGVCGPVTFNIRTGTYTATQAIVNRVKGGSAVNRVTFQSETGVAANVTLSFTGTSTTNNYVFRLDSASYITIKDLTIRNSATGTYAGVLNFIGDASYDSVVNCAIGTSVTTVSTSTNLALIFTNTFIGTDNVIKGNTFTNGGTGIYWWGASAIIRCNNTVIDNNTFTNQRYMGIYHYYGNNLKVRNNTFTSSGSLSSGYYGLNNYYCNGAFDVSGNTMTIASTTSGSIYGINNGYCYGDVLNTAQRGRVNNNTINITSTSSTTLYGIGNQYCNYDTISNNNVTTTSTSSSSIYTLYNYYSDNSYVLNNTFVGSSGTSYIYFWGLGYCTNSLFNNNTVTMSSGTSGTLNTYGLYYAHGSSMSGNTFDLATNTTSSSYPNNGYFNYYTNGGTFNKNTVNMTGRAYYQYPYLSYNCNDGFNDSNTINTTNTYTSGYTYALYAYGSSNSTAYANNTIRYNNINANVAYYCYGVYIPYTCRLLFEGNTIKMVSTGSTGYVPNGLYAYSLYDCIVRNNAVYHKAYYAYYPLYAPYPYGTANYIYNNTFSNTTTAGSTYAVYLYTNTSYSGKNFINNNIFNVNGGSYSYMFYGYDLSRFSMDYNMYNSTISNFMYGAMSGQAFNMGNLQSWRTAYGQDMNSLIYAPAFVNINTGDLHPDVTNSNAWPMNGRGKHMPGNTLDVDGNPRPLNPTQGAPDLGAYEHTPTSIPPNANVVGAATPGTTQYFLLGQDTVASVKWDIASTPAPLTVKQYSGAWPPAFINPFYMNIYTDIQPTPATGSYLHDVNFYYKDPQTGFTAGESALRLVKKDGTNPWLPFAAPQSVTDQNRNIIATTALTNFGFHTGSDVSNNAGATGVTAPVAVFCSPSSQSIKLTIKNLGNNVLNNVQVGYQFNGGAITTVAYNTPIQTLLHPAGNTATVTLANFNFTTGTPLVLKAWTSLPNGQVDPNPVDDTLNIKIWPGLKGIYTVGGTTPDFVDVREAVDIMNTWGVCGPVTFNIRDGAYPNNAYVLKNIPRVNATDRICFQSESGNAGAVNISNVANSSYVFSLDNASYITFKNLTITTGNATNCHTVELMGISEQDSVIGCNLNAPSSTSTTPATGSVVSVLFPAHNNYFIDNTLTGGGTGFYVYGNSNTATTWLSNIVVSGNTVSGQYYYCSYFYFTGGLQLRNNKFNVAGPSQYYGLYGWYFYGSPQITGNYINDTRLSNSGYSSYMYYIQGNSATDKAVFANNVLSQTSSAFTMYGGLYTPGPNNARFYNNTINTNSTYASGYAAYITMSGYTNNEIYNNVFRNAGSGYALYLNTSGTTNVSDYNNISGGGTNPFSNGTGYSTLTAWRAATGFDKNSIQFNPGFVSLTDLHPDASNPNSWSLNGRGIHIAGNAFDLDGNARVVNRADGVPDIGAYEFTPGTTPPAAVATPATPTAGVPQVFTFGFDTVAIIRWQPNSVVPTTVTVRQYTGTKGPSHPAAGFQYFYTDINAANITYNTGVDVYYKDPWLGTIGTESNLRMLRRLNPNPWYAYNGTLSNAEVTRNILRADTVTSLGWFTGIEDGTIFSAIITPFGNPVFCPGGSIVLKANLGVGYTYQWMLNGVPISGATNANYTATSAGDYTVAITNSSNVTTVSGSVAVTIVSPPSAIVTATGPLTYCIGNGLTLNANTGVGLTYQWQFNGNNIPGATGTSIPVTGSGAYTVTVKNIGCATTSSAVPVGSGPISVSLGLDTSYCEAGPLLLDAGYPGAKYTWSTGDTSQQITVYNQSGKYWVTVNAGPNCIGADTIKVDVSPLPSVVGISYLQNGTTYMFSPSGAQNAKSYLWIYTDGQKDTSKNSTHTFLGSGSGVMLVVYNDCGTDTTYLSNLSVGSVSKGELLFRLYPNPAQTEVTLSVSDGAKFSDVTIINGLGQVLYRGTSVLVSELSIDVRKYANGHYIMRASSAEGVIISKPFDVVR